MRLDGAVLLLVVVVGGCFVVCAVVCVMVCLVFVFAVLGSVVV